MSVHAISSMYRKFWPSSRKLSVLSNNGTKGFACDEFLWKNDTYDSSSQFAMMSFNLLAPCYKRLHIRDQITGRRVRESSSFDMWSTRANDTLKFFQEEVFSRKTSIVALQEFWLDTRYSSLFEKKFTEQGYNVKLLQRTGPKVDAVALMVRSDTFEILGSENVYLCSLADRVALMLWLRHTATGRHVIVANTHLSFPHNALDRLNQMRQMQNLTAFMDRYAADQNISGATRVIMGDFNVESLSPVCDHLRNAGYYSCFEVCPPRNVPPAEGTPVVATKKAGVKSVDSAILNLLNLDHTSPNKHAGGGHRIHCAPVEFISHHTHRSEDLGVDHIFVKPECEFTELETLNRMKVLQESVFVRDTAVLPQNMTCVQWHSEFSVSDHRPVEASLVFGRRK